MTGATHDDSARAELQIVVGSVLISFSAVFVKMVDAGPTASAFYRNVFGALALLALAFARRDALWKGAGPLKWVVLAGACFAADLFFWHRSILFVGPGLATILGNLQVFFVAAVGIFAFREPATPRFLFAIPLAVVGLFLLVGVNWSEFDATYRRGVVYGVLTALSYGAYLLCLRGSRRERGRLSATANLAWVSAATAALLGAVAWGHGESLHVADARSWAILIAYGVLCQAMGWIVISRVMHVVDASRVALILLLQPALTYLWDFLLFGRPLTPLETGGAVLTIASIYLGSMRMARAPAATS